MPAKLWIVHPPMPTAALPARQQKFHHKNGGEDDEEILTSRPINDFIRCHDVRPPSLTDYDRLKERMVSFCPVTPRRSVRRQKNKKNKRNKYYVVLLFSSL